MKPVALDWRYRMAVASRALAAIFGGYGLAVAATLLLSQILPMARSEAVVTASMLGFVAYAAAVCWAFAVHSGRQAWLGLLLPALLMAGLAWWLKGVAS